MKKDDIKTLIVIVIVCAICLILVLIFSREKNTDKLEAVKEYNTYFSEETPIFSALPSLLKES